MIKATSETAEMYAAVIRSFGGPDVLDLCRVPRPVPGEGELLVQVYAAGTNPVDAQSRADGSWAGIELPAILGSDASGVVTARGPGATEFAIGEEVFYLTDFLGGAPGTYAEYHAVDQTIVAHKPAALDHVRAAALPVAAGTALRVVHDRLDVQPGDWVLVHGASGGVGTHAVQLAKMRGARVVASASGEREKLMRDLGTEVFVDYRSGDVASLAASAIGTELDAAVDLVGDGFVERVLPFVREQGRVATVTELRGDFELAIDRNVTLHGVLVRPSRGLLEALGQLAAADQLVSVIDAVHPLDKVREVHRRLDSGHGRGKVVLAMPVLWENLKGGADWW